jgi:hypothetical protein
VDCLPAKAHAHVVAAQLGRRRQVTLLVRPVGGLARTWRLPRRCCTARWAGRKAARCATAALPVMLLLVLAVRHLRSNLCLMC